MTTLCPVDFLAHLTFPTRLHLTNLCSCNTYMVPTACTQQYLLRKTSASTYILISFLPVCSLCSSFCLRFPPTYVLKCVLSSPLKPDCTNYSSLPHIFSILVSTDSSSLLLRSAPELNKHLPSSLQPALVLPLSP